MGEWRARIEDDLYRLNVRLVLWRPRGDGRVEVVYPDRVETIDEAVAPIEAPGYPIPREALGALVEALLPFAPHRIEVQRLEQSLQIERDRVDRFLDVLVDQRTEASDG